MTSSSDDGNAMVRPRLATSSSATSLSPGAGGPAGQSSLSASVETGVRQRVLAVPPGDPLPIGCGTHDYSRDPGERGTTAELPPDTAVGRPDLRSAAMINHACDKLPNALPQQQAISTVIYSVEQASIQLSKEEQIEDETPIFVPQPHFFALVAAERVPGPCADAFVVDEDFVRRCRLAINIVADSPAALGCGAARGDSAGRAFTSRGGCVAGTAASRHCDPAVDGHCAADSTLIEDDYRLWHHFAVIAEATAFPEGPAWTGSDPVDTGSAGIQTKNVLELYPVGDDLEASSGSVAVSHLLSEQVLLQLAGIQTKRVQERHPVGAASLPAPQFDACGTGGT